MKISRLCCLSLLLILPALSVPLRAAPENAVEVPGALTWTIQPWKGEHAFVSSAGAWRAVVSTDRGRLIYFGPSAKEQNLLFAPETRNHPAGWGGHRVWLGPQDRWQVGWPPPKAWEASHAAVIAVEGGRLRLTMPDAGDGWPRVIREYSWQGESLHCRVEMKGGTRDAQIIQIVQVPPSAVVTTKAFPTESAPHGFVQVHLGRHPSPQANFASLPQVQPGAADLLELRFNGHSEKLAFRPQPLVARIGAYELRLARVSAATGAKQEPDDGYFTQVYLGEGSSSLIELEQLSPLYAGGADSFLELELAATVK